MEYMEGLLFFFNDYETLLQSYCYYYVQGNINFNKDEWLIF